MKFIFCTAQEFVGVVLIITNVFLDVQSSSCPALNSFLNHTGNLIVKKQSLTPINSIYHCQWLIVGSLEQRIVVEFEHVFISIPIDEYVQDRCRRGSVNLWTPGFENEKVEICGDRHQMRVAGVGRTLMIELRINDVELDFHFQLNYRLIQLERPLSTPVHLLNSSPSLTENYNECGQTSVDVSMRKRQDLGRIVGGRQATPHSHPWQVLLSDHRKFCGATILNANWIVTAAHCVNGTDRNDLLAEFGVHDRYSVEASRTKRSIAKILIYPAYTGKSTRWTHDIALLRLSESISFNPFVRSICLPTKEHLVRIGDRTIVTGWGETQGTGNFRYLREVDVPIQSNDNCQLTEISSNTSFCAGLCTNHTCDACQGDSGGPMVVSQNGRSYLVGLISWGFSCAGLGVYTKVSYYLDWIQRSISQHD